MYFWGVLFINLKKMRSLNKVMLMGHVVANPELKKIGSGGVNMAVFSVATNRDWIAGDGTKKEAVDYHRVIAWRKLADICSQHLVKGSPIFIQGRLQNTTFDGKDGKKRFFTEIVLEELSILMFKKQKDVVEVNVNNVTDRQEEEGK